MQPHASCCVAKRRPTEPALAQRELLQRRHLPQRVAHHVAEAAVARRVLDFKVGDRQLRVAQECLLHAFECGGRGLHALVDCTGRAGAGFIALEGDLSRWDMGWTRWTGVNRLDTGLDAIAGARKAGKGFERALHGRAGSRRDRSELGRRGEPNWV
eukprot:364542-Chlamydomonas_euryale.AAC.18